MRWSPRFSRLARAVLAVGFALSLLLFTAYWLVLTRPSLVPSVQLGFDNDYRASEHVEFLRSIYSNSPAEKAGLRAGDEIAAVDGQPLTSPDSIGRIWLRHRPGDQVHLTVRRPGVPAPISVTATFRPNPDSSVGGLLNQQLSNWFPLPFVIVGLAVLFLRLDDPHAWLLALMFAGVAVSRGLPSNGTRPPGWNFAVAYQALLIGIMGPMFYWFFSVFPSRSPLERRMPWRKWSILAVGLVLGVSGIRVGTVQLPPPFRQWIGRANSNRIATLILFYLILLGLVSFAHNYFTSTDAGARRKVRVMFWGTAISLGPALVSALMQTLTGWRDPTWLSSLHMALLFVFPLSFAYAVLVHQALEVPVLLRRSARYLLVQRGFTFLLSLVSIGMTLLFALSFARYLQPFVQIAQPAGIALGAVFGTVLLWSGTQVHKRVSGRIDRAFFRSAYDARVILEDLAEKSRVATGRDELAGLLEQHLVEALHPSFLSVHLQPAEPTPGPQPECTVPILGRDGRRLGLLLLGQRLSEEPYSREDQRLLASVASQAATALENIRLAEEIAQRIESERRTAREMEIAREVQSRLLPQSLPRLKTLDCAACCVQARAVGGDYYDFLDLGPDLLGLALGDVSGKGVHAALLVANLEAYLRSQAAIVPFDAVRALTEVNRLLYGSTAVQHYATLFFGGYDDSTRVLRYVNCGHNPPIWLHADGAVTRLEATATVIGAFAAWQATLMTAQLAPGDLLVVFSDGVTEANRGEEDFGEARLLAELRSRAVDPVDQIVSGILSVVQQFSAGSQYDDLTLLVARAR